MPGDLRDEFWRAPLAPVALAATAGVAADRLLGVPLGAAALVLLIALAGWAAAVRRAFGRGLPFVWLACAALGALHHHQYREIARADDVGHLASDEPRLVRLRGRIVDGPVRSGPPRFDPLRSLLPAETSRAELAASHWQARDDWLSASGRVRLTAAGRLDGLRPGDTVEATGWMRAPPGPLNPGEEDYAARLRDRQVRALLDVRQAPDGVVRLEAGATLAGAFDAARGWGRTVLAEQLPADVAGLAAALLLGDTTAMPREEWEKYVRTGVVHALAVSGQHLVVLAAFLWLALRVAGVRQARGAWLVGLALIAYALLTGARPPAVRAAAQVAVVCGGLVLRRPVLTVNAFALAWLIVLIVQPTDIADPGCQLSFLCVALLTWGTNRWFAAKELDPLDQLIAESRPAWQRALRGVGRAVAVSYGVTLALGIAVMPLVAARYHLVAPAGLLIGPPVVLLASIALVAGFLMLPIAAVAPVLAGPFAWVTAQSLSACDGLVSAADRLPWGHVYVGGAPAWWLLGFYPALMAVLLLPELRRRARWAALAAPAWLAVGLAGGAMRPAADELRVTFLAVGHGGCTVLETPDGRTLLYDAGALAGPDLTRRVVAPFLWQRGVRRIDELLVSHADLDHFNGLPALVERFPVGRVTLTPSFADKPAPGVRAALAAVERAGIATRTVRAGDVLSAGDVTLEVLHPPADGAPGPENVRSLVLDVRHAGHSILLTGDLEGAGLARVLALPPRRIDVLMAPHHGGRGANPPELAAWARPRLVVASQNPPPGPTPVPAVYAARGAVVLPTWRHGAVTVRSHRSGLVAETFASGERVVVRAGGA